MLAKVGSELVEDEDAVGARARRGARDHLRNGELARGRERHNELARAVAGERDGRGATRSRGE